MENMDKGLTALYQIQCRLFGQNYPEFSKIYLSNLSIQAQNTITYKSRLTQKKLHKKTDAISSIYGKNRMIPWLFF